MNPTKKLIIEHSFTPVSHQSLFPLAPQRLQHSAYELVAITWRINPPPIKKDELPSRATLQHLTDCTNDRPITEMTLNIAAMASEMLYDNVFYSLTYQNGSIKNGYEPLHKVLFTLLDMIGIKNIVTGFAHELASMGISPEVTWQWCQERYRHISQ